MGVILDTSALIGLFELGLDRPLIVESIREAGGTDRPAISIVTLGELAAGVQAAADGSDLAAARQRTLDIVSSPRRQRRFDVAPIDRPAWEQFGRIAAALTRKVGHNDKWIAATALATGRTLITQDATLAEHARRLEGLRVRFVARQPT